MRHLLPPGATLPRPKPKPKPKPEPTPAREWPFCNEHYERVETSPPLAPVEGVRPLSPAVLERLFDRELTQLAAQGPTREGKVAELLSFIFTRGLTRAGGWRGLSNFEGPRAQHSTTVFDQLLEATAPRSQDPQKAFRESVPAICGFIEDGRTLSRDQLACMIALYARLDLQPEAAQRMETMLSRISLSGDAEREKMRFLETLLAHHGRAPIDAQAMRKLTSIARMGGLTPLAKHNLKKILGEAPRSPEASALLTEFLEEPAVHARADWTFFVHIHGIGTLESDAPRDLLSMERVGSLPGRVNVVALVTSPACEWGYEGREWRSGVRLIHVRRTEDTDPEKPSRLVSSEVAIPRRSPLGLRVHGRRGEESGVDFTDPEVLRAAVNYVRKAFPSEHFLLDLWGHGASNGHPTTNRGTIVSAGDLTHALSGLGVDVINCNACHMATYEAALAAKSLGAKFLTASEESVPGDGCNYAEILAHAREIFEREGELTPRAIAFDIADHFVERSPEHQMYSATDLGRLPEVDAALRKFCEVVLRTGGLKRNQELRRAYERALRFDEELDLGDFARQVVESCKGAPAAAAKQLSEAIRSASHAVARKPEAPAEDDEESATTWLRDMSWHYYPGCEGYAAQHAERLQRATGLSIHAPTGGVSEHYTRRGTAWHGHPWLKLIETYSRR